MRQFRRKKAHGSYCACPSVLRLNSPPIRLEATLVSAEWPLRWALTVLRSCRQSRGFTVVSGGQIGGFRDTAGFSQAYLSVNRTRRQGASRCDHAPNAMSDQEHHPRSSWDGGTIGRMALWTAAAAGTVHGLFSLYWAMGGGWLLESLGADLIETFADSRWLLLPVGLAKIFAGLFPLLLARWAWPAPRLSRSACWIG